MRTITVTVEFCDEDMDIIEETTGNDTCDKHLEAFVLDTVDARMRDLWAL